MQIKTNISIIPAFLIGILPSFIKKPYYKWKGYTLGKNIKFGFGSAIIGKSVEIGDNSKIGLLTAIHASNIKLGRYSKIGNFCIIATTNVEIGEDSYISDNVIIRGQKHKDSLFKLGEQSRVDSHSILDCARPLIIGNGTGIASKCTVLTHGAWLSELDGYPVTFKPIRIGNNVWIGVNVIILSGTTIGDSVIVSASSRISGNIPSNCIVSGNPAKIITNDFPRKLKDEEKLKIINKMFDDFIEHLEYFGFSCEQVQLDYGFSLKVSKDNEIRKLLFVSKNSELVVQGSEQINSEVIDALILNIRSDKFDSNNIIDSRMQINIFDRTRKGNSEIGEEFIKFVSGLGLKFKRLD